MKIGIIESGNIGATLTRRLCELGHEVSVANSRGPQSLAELAAETGARPLTVTEAARGKDVVIVTIAEKKIPDLPAVFLTVSRRTPSSSIRETTIRNSATGTSMPSSPGLRKAAGWPSSSAARS